MHRKTVALASAGLLAVGVAGFAVGTRHLANSGTNGGRNLSLATALTTGDVTLSPEERGLEVADAPKGGGIRPAATRQSAPPEATPAVTPPEATPEPLPAQPAEEVAQAPVVEESQAEAAPAPVAAAPTVAAATSSSSGAMSLAPGQMVSAIPHTSPVVSTGSDEVTEMPADFRGTGVVVGVGRGGRCRPRMGGGGGTLVLR